MARKTEQQPGSQVVRYRGRSGDSTFVVTHPAIAGWAVRLHIDRQSGEVVEVTVMAEPAYKWGRAGEVCDKCGVESYPLKAAPPGGITTRLLRGVPLGELRQMIRDFVEPLARLSYDAEAAEDIRQDAGRRTGRAGRPDNYYATVAAMYVAALSNSPDAPVVALAKDLQLSGSQIRNLLYEARKRGLLTAAPRGRPGGMLTDRAKHLLENGRT